MAALGTDATSCIVSAACGSGVGAVAPLLLLSRVVLPTMPQYPGAALTSLVRGLGCCRPCSAKPWTLGTWGFWRAVAKPLDGLV
jgi:hypothetical protein